jgi:hypothetical protein
MRSSGHLTERLISKLAVGLHHDGEGLYAQVTLGLQHNVSWVLRYTLPEKVISKNRKTRNKERRAGLGRYPAHHTLPGGFSARLGLRNHQLELALPCAVFAIRLFRPPGFAGLHSAHAGAATRL